jgi:hypothetical protein
MPLPEGQRVKFDREHMEKVKIGSRIGHEVEREEKRREEKQGVHRRRI